MNWHNFLKNYKIDMKFLFHKKKLKKENDLLKNKFEIVLNEKMIYQNLLRKLKLILKNTKLLIRVKAQILLVIKMNF